jgi:hypothetical protein
VELASDIGYNLIGPWQIFLSSETGRFVFSPMLKEIDAFVRL